MTPSTAEGPPTNTPSSEPGDACPDCGLACHTCSRRPRNVVHAPPARTGSDSSAAPVRPRIRDEIWVKLWGNLSFNPISALTLATLEDMVRDDGTRAVIRAMMVEAQAVAEKLGVKFPIGVDKRIEGGGAVGAHKTSMLQDLERGRPMEYEALVGAVAELGRIVELPTPIIDTVLALIRLRAKAG
jgi:2-dehydropantoate 2-reductase